MSVGLENERRTIKGNKKGETPKKDLELGSRQGPGKEIKVQ